MRLRDALANARATDPKHPMRRVDQLRRTRSATMTTLTALCTVVAVGILLVILFYIARQGISALTLRFLVESPRPVGEGGGIGNAILGTLVLLGLSSAIGLAFSSTPSWWFLLDIFQRWREASRSP